MGGHGELLELLHARLREALLEIGGAMANAVELSDPAAMREVLQRADTIDTVSRAEDEATACPATTTILGCFVKLPPPTRRRYIVHVKPTARAHTAAPHCLSHCHQLRVDFNTPVSACYRPASSAWRRSRGSARRCTRSYSRLSRRPVLRAQCLQEVR